MMCELQAWAKEYQETVDTPPQPGDILQALEGDALLTVEIKDGNPPFIYGRAYVPEIVNVKSRWYLQAEGSHSYHGWKCVLMPRARAALIQTCGLSADGMAVKSLRVIRHSQTGKSILCEVHEYAQPSIVFGDAVVPGDAVVSGDVVIHGKAILRRPTQLESCDENT